MLCSMYYVSTMPICQFHVYHINCKYDINACSSGQLFVCKNYLFSVWLVCSFYKHLTIVFSSLAFASAFVGLPWPAKCLIKILHHCCQQTEVFCVFSKWIMVDILSFRGCLVRRERKPPSLQGHSLIMPYTLILLFTVTVIVLWFFHQHLVIIPH